MEFEKQANEVFNDVCGVTGCCGTFNPGDNTSRELCECRYNIEQALRQSYAQAIEDAANCAKHLSGWGNGKRASHEHAEHIANCIRSLNKEEK